MNKFAPNPKTLTRWQRIKAEWIGPTLPQQCDHYIGMKNGRLLTLAEDTSLDLEFHYCPMCSVLL